MYKKRCMYCGKLITNVEDYCNGQCKTKYSNLEKKTTKHLNYFWILVTISLITAFLGELLTGSNEVFGNVISNSGVLLFFISLIIFPFSTPRTVKYLGMKRAKLVVRIIAFIFIIYFLLSNIF